MNPLDFAIAICGLTALITIYRIARGPTSADRAVAADLMTFTVVALIALVGVRLERIGTFDLVLVATLMAFLAAVSLARALSRGQR